MSINIISNNIKGLYQEKTEGNPFFQIDQTLKVQSINLDNSLNFILQKSDFPDPNENDIINLLDNATYFICNNIDLSGSRLIAGDNTVLIGGSSENCILSSNGLAPGLPLISSSFSLPMRHIGISASLGFEISGSTSNSAYDWYAVNFINCDIVGKIHKATNFRISDSAMLGSGPVQVIGEVGTISFKECLFSTKENDNSIEIQSTANITRRLRIIYSSFVTSSGSISVLFDENATIPTESYILDTVNFSGDGTYISGVIETSNSSLFKNCVGIQNTSVNGQIYSRNNALATNIVNSNEFYKVAGNTTSSVDNAKYGHINNRLTCEAIIQRKYLINCHLSFNAGSNNICEFGFYDSKLESIREPSKTKTTANSGGRAENVSLSCITTHTSGNYIELHASNTSSTNNITVTDFVLTITEFE